MDNTVQRQNVAAKAVLAATAIIDNLNQCSDLSVQVSKFTSGFVDTDFENGAQNPQLSAGMLNVFFNNVLPVLKAVVADNATYTGTGNQSYVPDSSNLGRNQQILDQMRQG